MPKVNRNPTIDEKMDETVPPINPKISRMNLIIGAMNPPKNNINRNNI